MSRFKNYRKTKLWPMRPYVEGEPLPPGCSVGDYDREAGSPKPGDMIAANPDDETDTWLVAEEFFKENYELADEQPPSPPGECLGGPPPPNYGVNFS